MNNASTNAVFRINLRKLNVILMLACLLGAASYFLTINGLSTTGFAFKDLKQRANELAAENQQLESQVSSLSSFQNLNPRIADLHLVPVSDVAYVSWDSRMVARK